MQRRKFILSAGLSLIAPSLIAATEEKRPSLEIISSQPNIPDFKLTDLDGKEHSPEQYRGKVLLINFWATWCPPCLAEMESMARLHELEKEQDFSIIAIAMGQTDEQIKEYRSKNPQPFPLLADPDSKVSEAFGVTGLPTSFLTTRSGQLAFKAQGGRKWDADRMVRTVALLLS